MAFVGTHYYEWIDKCRYNYVLIQKLANDSKTVWIIGSGNDKHTLRQISGYQSASRGIVGFHHGFELSKIRLIYCQGHWFVRIARLLDFTNFIRECCVSQQYVVLKTEMQ